jgi:tetratricopeptide (TPR) repeat protein
VKWTLIATILLAAVTMVRADSTQSRIFAKRAEAEFDRAQRQFQSDTNDTAAACQFARACFDYADFATDSAGRAALARRGIAACRQVIARDPKAVAAHYYLGMNLGQLARTETFGALKLVKEMEREFKTAVDQSPDLDYAGPERSLGLLYRDAPGWPTSIGSKRKARDYLERAVKLAPDYPENRLNLIESYLKWNEYADAKQQLDALDALWPGARKKLTGEKWEQSWDDWTTRRDAARKTLDENSAFAKPSKNPR